MPTQIQELRDQPLDSGTGTSENLAQADVATVGSNASRGQQLDTQSTEAVDARESTAVGAPDGAPVHFARNDSEVAPLNATMIEGTAGKGASEEASVGKPADINTRAAVMNGANKLQEGNAASAAAVKGSPDAASSKVTPVLAVNAKNGNKTQSPNGVTGTAVAGPGAPEAKRTEPNVAKGQPQTFAVKSGNENGKNQGRKGNKKK